MNKIQKQMLLQSNTTNALLIAIAKDKLPRKELKIFVDSVDKAMDVVEALDKEYEGLCFTNKGDSEMNMAADMQRLLENDIERLNKSLREIDLIIADLQADRGEDELTNKACGKILHITRTG